MAADYTNLGALLRTAERNGTTDIFCKDAEFVWKKCIKGKNPAIRNFDGDTIYWSVKTQAASGGGFSPAQSGQQLPQMRTGTWKTASGTMSNFYSAWSFHKTLFRKYQNEMNGSTPASVFAKIVVDTMADLMKEYVLIREINFFRGKEMKLAAVSANTSTATQSTLTITHPNSYTFGQTQYIPRSNISVSVYNSAGTIKRGSGRVSSIDYANAQIVVTPAIPSAVNTDILVWGDANVDSYNIGYYGMPDFLNVTDTLFGINPTTEPLWQANILRSTSADEIPWDWRYLIQGTTRCSQRVGTKRADVMSIMHPALALEHAKTYEGDLTYMASDMPFGYARGEADPAVYKDGTKIAIDTSIYAPFGAIMHCVPKHLCEVMPHELAIDRGIDGNEPVHRSVPGADEVYGYRVEHGQVLPEQLGGFGVSWGFIVDSNRVDDFHSQRV